MKVKVDKPSLSLLCKLGSIIVHAEESASTTNHIFDRIALRSLLEDPEVEEWMDEMKKAALLPVRRKHE